jgi:hypothetical protein
MPNLFRRARKHINETPARILADGASPLVAPLRNVVEGPSHRFAVHADAGWSGRDIEALLASYGVTLWDKLALGNRISFSVRQAQAQWTQYLLERQGLTLMEGALPTSQRSVPTSLDGLCNWVADAISSLLDSLGV